jgi:hypothetical protein
LKSIEGCAFNYVHPTRVSSTEIIEILHIKINGLCVRERDIGSIDIEWGFSARPLFTVTAPAPEQPE